MSACSGIEAENDAQPDISSNQQGLRPPPSPGAECTHMPHAPPTIQLVGVGATTATLKITSRCEAGGVWLQSKGAGGVWSNVGFNGLSPYQIEDAGLRPGANYCFRGAETAHGVQQFSSELCVTTSIAPPDAPLLSQPIGLDSSIPLFVNDESNNEDGFKIYSNTNGGGQWFLLADIPSATKAAKGDLVTYTHQFSRTDTASHCYLVGAYNAGGTSYAAERCTVLLQPLTAPREVFQWQCGNSQPLPLEPAELYNNQARSKLIYDSRPAGINLGWDSTASGNIRIQRNPLSSDAPLTFGERFAIKVDGGGYLQYGERVWGINLEWSSTPSFEWVFVPFGSDQSGWPVVNGGALWNSAHGNFLVYESGRVGVNLGWYQATPDQPPDPTPDPHLQTELVTLNKSVPPISGGWAWWTGLGFLHGQTSTITVPVQNLNGIDGLFFLKYKPGITSAACGNVGRADIANVGAWVPVGTSMTEAQKQLVFGTAMPAAPTGFLTCAGLTTTGVPDSVKVQVQVMN